MFARQSFRTVAKPMYTRNASSLVQSATSIGEKSVYWSKVIAELSKQVYTKEGLSPPTVGEFTKVYECTVKQATSLAKNPKAYADLVAKNAQGFSKDEIIRYFCYFIQILGFFSLGEIIGRRHIVGYESYGPKTESHH